MIKLPAGNKRQKKLTIELKNFKGGTNKLLEEARVALNEATVSKT